MLNTLHSDEAPAELSLHISVASFDAFCRFIQAELGIKMSRSKIPMLQSRLQRRLRELRLSLDDYRRYLFDSPGAADERVHFINAVTTNKTDFFREPQHFEYLTQLALPALDPDCSSALKRRWHLKVWCAGCSSGEEAYTLAMVLSEYAHQRPGFDFSVLATDVSTRVLDQAQRAIYHEERVEPVAANLRKLYLLRNRDSAARTVRIKPELRGKVMFHHLNFMDADYRIRDVFDVIFFRNVMIYFDKPTQEMVINRQCRNLRSGGYLFVGHSESLGGLQIPVLPVSTAIYRKPE